MEKNKKNVFFNFNLRPILKKDSSKMSQKKLNIWQSALFFVMISRCEERHKGWRASIQLKPSEIHRTGSRVVSRRNGIIEGCSHPCTYSVTVGWLARVQGATEIIQNAPRFMMGTRSTKSTHSLTHWNRKCHEEANLGTVCFKFSEKKVHFKRT